MPFPSGTGRGGDPYSYYTDDPTAPPQGPPGPPGGGGDINPFGGAPLQQTFPQPGTLPYARRRRLAGRVSAFSQPSYFGPAYDSGGGGGGMPYSGGNYGDLFGYGGMTAPETGGGYGTGMEGGLPPVIVRPPVTGPGPGVPRGTGQGSSGGGWGNLQPWLRDILHKRFTGQQTSGGPADPWAGYNPLTTDPTEYLKRFPGIAELMNPTGSDALFNALYGQGVSQAGAAERAALVGARARGLGGTPYGLLAAEAQRQAQGEAARNMFGARAESIGRNQEFIGRMAGGYQDFLNQLYRERQQYQHELDLERLRQAFQSRQHRGWTLGVGGVTVGH